MFTLPVFCLDDGQPDNHTFPHYCFLQFTFSFSPAITAFLVLGLEVVRICCSYKSLG